MKFLIDTNIFISVEPTDVSELESGSPAAVALLGRMAQLGCQVYVHPLSARDISNDVDETRRRTRELLLRKYAELPFPPSIPETVTRELGSPVEGSNDWIDLNLLSALVSHAADFLVTEDIRLQKKARRLNLADRVGSVSDIDDIFDRLYVPEPSPPPAVQHLPLHAIDVNDSLFDSLRQDYAGFDKWFSDGQKESRYCWAIRDADSGLAGICIYKLESNPGYEMTGTAVKLCTFKIADSHAGRRLGELLLKTALSHAEQYPGCWIYTTVFPKLERLLEFLNEFGFKKLATKENGELVMGKTTDPTRFDNVSVSPLDYHVLLGPPTARVSHVPGYVVPIEPQYHALLFPEAEAQQSFWPGRYPFGNSLRKAYLSNAPIRSIVPGGNLFFYRSHDEQAITVHGVVECVMVSSTAAEIATFVGKRTVYSYFEIQGLCCNEVVAILFRQARILRSPIRLTEMISCGMTTSHPQSIQSIPEEVSSWLATRLTT